MGNPIFFDFIYNLFMLNLKYIVSNTQEVKTKLNTIDGVDCFFELLWKEEKQ